MIKAIIFDFGGVVAPVAICQWLKNNFEQNDLKYVTIKKYIKEKGKKWDMGKVSVDEFYELLSGITGLPKASLQTELYDKSTFHPEVIKIIRALKQHYKIVLFSNNFAHNLYKLLDQHNLRNLFNEIVISSEHKLTKPNPRFYQLMLSLASVTKNEVIFIDDTQANVDGGNNIGITSFLYSNPQQLIKDLKSQGVRV